MASGATIGLPGADVTGQPFVVVPLGELSALEGRPIAGLIGDTLLSQFLVSIDFERKTLRLGDREGTGLSRDGDAIPVELHNGQPWIDAAISPAGAPAVHGLFLVDTGSNRALHVNQPFAAAHDLLAAFGDARTMQSSGEGVGGRVTFTDVRAARVEIGGRVLRQPVVSIASAIDGLGENIGAGLIGNDILRRFTLTLDYRSARIRLKPNAHYGDPYDIDMSGLQLATETNAFDVIHVRAVRPDSPAAVAGIKAGDDLVSIDGRMARDLGFDQMAAMFKMDGKTYRLLLARGRDAITVSLTTRRPL